MAKAVLKVSVLMSLDWELLRTGFSLAYCRESRKKNDLISFTRPPKLCGLGYVLLTWAIPEHTLFCKNKVKINPTGSN